MILNFATKNVISPLLYGEISEAKVFLITKDCLIRFLVQWGKKNSVRKIWQPFSLHKKFSKKQTPQIVEITALLIHDFFEKTKAQKYFWKNLHNFRNFRFCQKFSNTRTTFLGNTEVFSEWSFTILWRNDLLTEKSRHLYMNFPILPTLSMGSAGFALSCRQFFNSY